MFEHILLATDGSDASDHAARIAVNLARELHARLTVVYVVDPYPYLGVGEANPMGLNAYLSAGRDHAGAVAGILATAKEEGADLIVAGSHGRSGIEKLMLGSVAGRLATLSPVPVLIGR